MGAIRTVWICNAGCFPKELRAVVPPARQALKTCSQIQHCIGQGLRPQRSKLISSILSHIIPKVAEKRWPMVWKTSWGNNKQPIEAPKEE